MIEESGEVVALDGDRVFVRAASRAGCKLCAQGRGCGGGLIGMLVGDRLATVQAASGDAELAIGDRVRLGLPGGSLVAAAAAVYLVPLAGFLIALLFVKGMWPAASDLWMVAGGAVGLAAGVVIARWLAGRGRRRRWQPRVLLRVEGADGRCG